jgi:riboflavin transporter
MRPTLRITLIALLAAWSVALNLLPSPPPTYLFKFSGFPLVLSGFVVGPAGGFWCGALADILGILLRPSGPYLPMFTLTSGLTGCLPVWLYLHLPRRPLDVRGRLLLNPVRLLLAVLLSQIGTKVLLVTTFRAIVFGLPWRVLALRAALEQAVHAPLYAYGVSLVLRRVVLRAAPASRATALDWASGANPGPSPPTGPGVTPVSPPERPESPG